MSNYPPPQNPPPYPPPYPPQYPPQYPQAPYPPPYQPPPQTHTMAVVSLVFGLLSFVGCAGLGSIIAIIAGNMALGDIRANPLRYSGGGMANAGIIMGWISLGLTVCAICAWVFYMVFVILISSSDFSWLPPLTGWL